MTDTELKETIKQILAAPQDFVMSHGGEGQEFITSLISEYSPRYIKTDVEIDTTKNRSNSIVPRFYTMLAGMITTSSNTEEKLVDDLALVIKQHNFSEQGLSNLLLNAKQYHAEAAAIGTKRISRMHFSGSSYFNKNNTWFLYLDNYDLYEFKWAMWLVKLWRNEIQVERDFNYVLNSVKTYALTHNLDTVGMYDQLEQMVLARKPATLKEGYIAYLQWIPATTLPDNYLDIPIEELYNNLKDKIPGYYNDMNGFIANAGALDSLNVIPYSRLTEPGFIEGMFDITNPEFNIKLKAWHQNNLSVVQAAGFDTTKWVL